jgi:hypothetical protein
MAPSLPGHDPDNPIRISRDPDSPGGWRTRADHPAPRYADIVPDGLTQIRVPRPPTDRGWQGRRFLLDDLRAAFQFNQALDAAVRRIEQDRASDITFENETRPW